MKGGEGVSNGNVSIPVHVDRAKLDEAVSKAERIGELLKEARSLAGELASLEVPISVDV